MTDTVLACSICRCGDPTFNALGKEGVSQTGLRVALDWDRVAKTQGSGDEKESLTENRLTVLGAYGISDRVAVIARIPYSWRSLESNDGGAPAQADASGRADPEVYGQVRLWSSPFTAAVGVRTSVFAVFGVKTAWGENTLTREGERLDALDPQGPRWRDHPLLRSRAAAERHLVAATLELAAHACGPVRVGGPATAGDEMEDPHTRLR